MGVRIRYEFTSDFEAVEWKCEIHDSDYVATINDAVGNGFNITYNGNGDAPLANIKGSSCQLNLIWRDSDTFIQAFINDLKAANEHEFALVIYKDNVLYWVGNITGDSLMWNNENTSRELVINAIDGLGRLRDMNYNRFTSRYGAGSIKLQVFEVILDLLSLNNLDQFWGASDPYIEFEPHWILNTSYRDWLDRLSVPQSLFYNIEKSDKSPRLDILEGKPAYECLELILTHLNMRIIHSDGRYFIQQVMGMSGASAAYRYTYYKGNTPISSSPFKWWQAENTTVARNSVAGTDVDVLAGGKFSYFQGLQSARMELPDQLYILKDLQQNYVSNILQPSSCPFTGTTNIGTVTGGSGRRMTIYVNMTTNSVGVISQYNNRYFIRLTYKVEAGSYRLSGGGVNNFSRLSWTTTASDTVVYDYPKSAYLMSHQHLKLQTPEIPWGIETVSVSITYDVIDSNTGASYTQNNLTYKINMVNISLEDADGPIGLTRLNIRNPTITDYENNTVYEHPDYLLNDFTPVNQSVSFLLNTTTTTFASIVSADSGHNTDEVISKTILQDAMSLQIHPIQVYEGAISGSYEPYKTFQYGSDYYVFNGGTLDAKNDEWNCQWWQSSPELGTIGNPDRDGGRGWDYDGDDVARPYIIPPDHTDHYGDVKNGFYREKIGSGGGTFGSTVTSLPMTTATEGLFKSGDNLIIMNPDTLELLEEVTLTADVDASDTTMSISSVTLENNIPPDAIVMLKGSDGFATPMVRTDELQLNGTSYTSIPEIPILSYSDIFRSSVVTWTPVSTGYQKVSISTLSAENLLGFTYSAANHELTYTEETKRFRISFNCLFYTTSGTDRIAAALFTIPISTGVPVVLSESITKKSIGTAVDTLSGQCIASIANGDKIYLGIARETGSGEINAESISILANQIEL